MMASLSPSPEKDAMEGALALQTFQERMESSLPLRHFTEFYAESGLEEVALQERARILVEFMTNVAGLSSSCVIPDLVQKLISEIEKVIENLRKRNQEHRKMTESIVAKYIEAHSSRYQISVEAQLSLNPGMGFGQREHLFEMTRLKVVGSFDSDWLPARVSSEFRLEQKAKLNMNLDLIKNRIKGNQVGVSPSSGGNHDAKAPSEEFETTPSSLQYEVENQDNGDSPNTAEQDAFSIWTTEGSKASPDLSVDKNGTCVDEDGERQVWNESTSHQECVMRYRCNKCGDSFNNISHYRSHLWSHRGERPFVCQVCKRNFASKDGLRIHMNIHTGKYACDQCSTTFRNQRDLNFHLNTHSGIRPYGCSLCSASFTRKFTRDKHLKWVHNRPKQASEKVAQEMKNHSPGDHPVVVADLQTSASLMPSKASVTRENATSLAGNSASESFPWNMLPSVPNASSSTPKPFPTDIPVVDLSD